MRTVTALLAIIWTARIRRVPFLAAGVVLAAIKFAIDQTVTGAFRGEPWSPRNYLVWPLDAIAQDLLGGASDPAYPLLMGVIAGWDPPRHLAFDVVAQPAPMRELSPYEIHPDHLDSHLTSHRGEFRHSGTTAALPDGHTRLVGTM